MGCCWLVQKGRQPKPILLNTRIIIIYQMTIGLFVGRFQPFHNGHLKVIRYILTRENHVRIVIGSSQKSFIPRNPFTAGERWMMIHSALLEEGISLDKFSIFQIPDVGAGVEWRAKLLSHVPYFDTVYAHVGDTMAVFEDIDINVSLIPKFTGRSQLRGTFIRDSMKKSTDIWKGLVPSAVSNYIMEYYLHDRVAMINGKD